MARWCMDVFGANCNAMRGDAQRAALAGLHAFLDEDGAFTALLERLEHGVHRRLRFARVARAEKLEEVWAFLESAAQLLHCHRFFQRKLRGRQWREERRRARGGGLRAPGGRP